MDVCCTDSSEKGKKFWILVTFLLFSYAVYRKDDFLLSIALWQLNKAIQYLWQTASRWNRYAMTFLLQKWATTYLCSCKRLVLFYRHDLCCQIMILPYSHSLSVQSVARNGYGYIDNAEVEVLWAMTKAVELLRKILQKGGMCYW